ncbi:MAG: response regulator [Propionibacteriaceae bacterium]
MIRLLVVDDQALVRGGFALILGADPEIDVIGQAADGIEALTLARRTKPDVVLMDVQMPRMDGIEATRHLVSSPQTGDVRVLVLTTFEDEEYVYGALRAGASGFLLKDTEPADLVAAVKVVADGESLLAPSVTRRLIARFVAADAGRDPRKALPPLTERELDVLVAVARGLSNLEIAGELFVSHSTVKTHVSHLLAKLGARDRAQLVMLAYRSGLARP